MVDREKEGRKEKKSEDGWRFHESLMPDVISGL
jgi:hypothetical protein